MKTKIKQKLDNNIFQKLYDEYKDELKKLINKHDIYLNKTKDKMKESVNKIKKSKNDKINMSKNILKHKSDIWCPSHDIKMKNLELNRWFTIKE